MVGDYAGFIRGDNGNLTTYTTTEFLILRLASRKLKFLHACQLAVNTLVCYFCKFRHVWLGFWLSAPLWLISAESRNTRRKIV